MYTASRKYTFSVTPKPCYIREASIRTVRQGINLRVLARIAVDATEAGKRVLAVEVHGARAADTLAA